MIYYKTPTSYVTSGITPHDSHGGHAAEHIAEMEAVSNIVTNARIDMVVARLNQEIPRIVEECVNRYGAQVWSKLIAQLSDSLNGDMTSIVNVGINGISEIFHGEKCQSFISTNVMALVKAEIEKLSPYVIK